LDFFQLHPDYLNLELCLVYRNYATLFFVFLIDQSESQLGILDLIQVKSCSPRPKILSLPQMDHIC
jgi:hypothetical protein